VAGSTFYCVTNMPGAYPCTSTMALTNHTLPYVVALAEAGWAGACLADPTLARGSPPHAGLLLSPEVAAAQGRTAVPAGDVPGILAAVRSAA
jgi:alanine dehydrogenase